MSVENLNSFWTNAWMYPSLWGRA